MNINAVIGCKTSPSGWYRINAVCPLLRSHGVEVNEVIPRFSRYPPTSKLMRPAWFIASMVERLGYLHRLRNADVTILQRELISTIPTIERLLPGKIILDVDDAIFLKKKGFAARNAAKASTGIVCGNNYLANYFSKYNRNVEVIPTGVDVNKMRVVADRLHDAEIKIVGWIGTPANLLFFRPYIEDLIALVNKGDGAIELRIVTSDEKAIPESLRPYCRFVRWYPGIEFEELPYWSVGIMPLSDSDWARGKCSFKMLQYMSAGIPVVVSPVGMNAEVLSKGQIGFGAESGQDWYSSLLYLLENREANESFGREARLIAETEYSLQAVASKWISVLNKWC